MNGIERGRRFEGSEIREEALDVPSVERLIDAYHGKAVIRVPFAGRRLDVEDELVVAFDFLHYVCR